MEDIFETIYSIREWENGSGPGSYPTATRPYRMLIETFIEWNGVREIFDLGCGDWQSSRYIDWGTARYIGIDCVKSLIDTNNRKFSEDNVHFMHCDILDIVEYPESDLAIVKDVFQHWIFEDIKNAIERLRSFKYVIFTNCKSEENYDLGVTGPFHPLNMARPPFSLDVVTLLEWDTKITQLWQPR